MKSQERRTISLPVFDEHTEPTWSLWPECDLLAVRWPDRMWIKLTLRISQTAPSPPFNVVDPDSIIKQLTMDKKVKDGKNNFILLNDIGNSYISNNVTINMIKDSIIKLWIYLL